MEDDEAIQHVAGQYVERLGRDAPKDLRERAEQAQASEDRPSADAWREIAKAAERLL
jgi:hypothetical protein